VTEELLHRADVRARLQQVGGEAMPQRVASDGFRDVRPARRVPDGVLQDRLVPVVAPRLLGEWESGGGRASGIRIVLAHS